MEDLKKGVGQKIRDARKAKGLTQNDAAQKIGVALPTYKQYENGKQNFTLETLGKLANAFQVPVKYFLG